MKFYKLVDRKPVECTPMEYAEFSEDKKNMTVAFDELPGDKKLSTVFIGINCFFETALSVEEKWSVYGRYNT